MADHLAMLAGVGVVGAVTALIGTPLAALLARWCGAVDRPGGYKAHRAPTPLFGGLAVAAGTAAGVLVFLATRSGIEITGLYAVGLGSLVIIVAGLLDDMRGLSPRHKFMWQVAAAAAAGACLAAFGVHLDLFLVWSPALIITLTVVWVVAITNAFNFLDNMDGLCASLGAVAAATLAVANARSGEFGVAVASTALCGACLGFLPFNWPRGRVFLGDTGAMLIGFLLAALSVLGVYTRGAPVPLLAVLTPLFTLGIPVLDLVLVMLIRLRLGHPLWVGDRRHISHRLVRRGMQPAVAVAALSAASGACGLAALLLPTVGTAQAPLLLALLLLALGALAAAAGTEGLPSTPVDDSATAATRMDVGGVGVERHGTHPR